MSDAPGGAASVHAAIEAMVSTAMDVYDDPQLGRIWYPRVLSVGDGIRLTAAADKGRGELLLVTLMLLARDESGRRLFGEHQRRWLEQVLPFEVLVRVVGAMRTQTPAESQDTAKKPMPPADTSPT